MTRIRLSPRRVGPVLVSAIVLLLVFLVGAAEPRPIDLALPLPADLPVVSSFGEFRAGHLHAGLDFSTRGELGWPVRAAADGEVYRLKVEQRGYGRAIYVRHADGYETVYGHLHAFDDATLGLERFVAAEAKRRGTRYPGDLYLDPPVKVRAGQRIGLTGEAGGGPPHLHLELRQAGEPVDPIRFGELAPSGLAAPRLDALWIVPRGPCRVDGRPGAVQLPFERAPGGYRLASSPMVEGSFDLEVDALVSGGGKMGLARLELTCGGERVYRADLHRFSFEQFRQAGLIYDVGRSRTSPARYTYRLRAPAALDLPGVEGAWLREPPEGSWPCELRAEGPGGRATLGTFTLQIGPSPSYASSLPDEVRAFELFPRLLLVNGSIPLDPRRPLVGARDIPGMPHVSFPNRAGARLLAPGGIEISFSADAFYEPVPIAVSADLTAAAPEPGLEPVLPPVRLDPPALFLRTAARLRATVDDAERSAFYWYDPARKSWGAMGKEIHGDVIEEGTRAGGTFAVFRDVSPPRIRSVQIREEKRLAMRRLVFPVEEIGEGVDVDAFEATLDGKPVEAEYDPDRKWGQIWLPDDLGGRHAVTARCRDRAGNASDPFQATVSL